MIGYKAFDKNLCCKGFQFEVGNTYETGAKSEDMQLCTGTVFHYCRDLFEIENVSNYTLKESRICEIIAGDFVVDYDRKLYGTNKITILREIAGIEKDTLISQWDADDHNEGKHNKGSYNTGDYNKGSYNIGDYNKGIYNTGDHNKGSYNTGSWNAGSLNVGNWNAGNYNAGDYNIGDCNTGNWNIGDCNTGSWNICDHNTGFFNTIISPIRMFNKDIPVDVKEINFPDFLRFNIQLNCTRHDYKKAFRLAWDAAHISEHKKLIALPNWDNEIFKEISGIDAEAEIAQEEAHENQQ